MEMKWRKVFALLMALVLATGVVAASPDGWKEKFEKLKEMHARDKARLHNHFGIVVNEDTFDEAKRWLLASADLAIASVVSIEEKIENSNLTAEEKELLLSELDEHLADLQTAREHIESSTTIEELREAGKELKQAWIETKVTLKKALAFKWIGVLQRMVDKGDIVEERVNELIEKFQSEGKDTTELEKWLEKFNEDRMRAQEKIDEAKEKITEIDNNKQANKALKEINEALKNAVKYTRNSFVRLKHIIRMINSFESGSVELEGKGVLDAVCEGYAEIQGKGMVMIRGEGNVTITPKDAVVSVTGVGSKIENNDTVTFSGEGKVVVKGDDIHVTIEGKGLRIHAVGAGTAYLDGTGTYKVRGVGNITEGEWSGEVNYVEE